MFLAIKRWNEGFTLIELSIVLVIIGLIIGGIVVGQDMIRSAAIRAQITQLQQFKAASETFRGKYNSYPGDMRPSEASAYGFFTLTGANAGTRGYGDNNGIIQSCVPAIYSYECGENIVFWRHLSEALLISGAYGANINAASGVVPGGVPIASIGTLLPTTKLGQGAFISLTDHGYYSSTNGEGYFILMKFTSYGIDTTGLAIWDFGVSVSQAYEIDVKLDDGMPTTGQVSAVGGLCIDSSIPVPIYHLRTDIPSQGPNSLACELFYRFK